jgi:spore maturation protein CgeB
MGTGVMCLTRNYEGIKEDFSPGVDLAVWDSFDELKTNIDHYLENDAERQEIARKGNELMLKSFTYDQMILNILKFVK